MQTTTTKATTLRPPAASQSRKRGFEKGVFWVFSRARAFVSATGRRRRQQLWGIVFVAEEERHSNLNSKSTETAALDAQFSDSTQFSELLLQLQLSSSSTPQLLSSRPKQIRTAKIISRGPLHFYGVETNAWLSVF